MIIFRRPAPGLRARRTLAAGLGLTLAVGTLIAVPESAVAAPSCSSDSEGLRTTCVYTAVNGEQSFVVPTGISAIDVVAVGASGGRSKTSFQSGASYKNGGRGAKVTGRLSVTAGQSLTVEVGGFGGNGDANSAGFNGGGAPGDWRAGGGGGASDVRLYPGADSRSLGSRLIIAAGGGGGGAYSNAVHNTGAGYGGDAGSAGRAGGRWNSGTQSYDASAGAGGGATSTAGGAGGGGLSAYAGRLGFGGAGQNYRSASTKEGAGGGGGGGLYGGGGGQAADLTGNPITIGGGGGGGSSLVPSGGTLALAALEAMPMVTISYAYAAAAPAVTQNPRSVSGPVGTAVSFTAAASGRPVPTVQWQRAGAGLSSQFVNIAGATSTTYSTTIESGRNGSRFRAVFTNRLGTAITQSATMIITS